MAISNQGYRRDLNLQETTNDTLALDNLAGAGTADDISYLQNNLRNTSNVAFNTIDSNGFFNFSPDKLLAISKISSEGNKDANDVPINSSSVTFTLTNSYLLKFGDLVEVSGIPDTSNASILNGQHSVIAVNPDLTRVTFTLDGLHFNDSDISISGVSFRLKSQNVFVYTDGDVINFDVSPVFTVAIGGPTIEPFTINTNYYVVESDGVSKFKLSSSLGGTPISILGFLSANPDNFQFKRQDPVHQQQVINFIEPQVQDNANFNYPDDINGLIDSTQSNIESAEYFSLKKYRSDQSLTTDDQIKFEGSINLHDPAKYNTDGNKVVNKNPDGSTIPNAPAPGIYISDTRAFSADNNPWVESSGTGNDNGKLTTGSEEVSIGELAFLDGNNSMIITGIDDQVTELSTTVDASSFTHKLPIKIQDENGNQESYYLLVSTS